MNPHRSRFEVGFFLLWSIAVGFVFLFLPNSSAWSRIYRDYEVVSLNGRFIGRVGFEPKPRVTVFELKNGQRLKRWRVPLWKPISEEIHLFDDGESMVLVDYYPYTDRHIHFFHKGNKVSVLSVEDVLDTLPNRETAPFRGGMYPQHLQIGRFIDILVNVEGAPYYALWLSESADWRAWNVATGQQVEPTPTLISEWDRHAEALCLEAYEKARKDMRLQRPRGGLPQPLPGWNLPKKPLPSGRVALEFFVRRNTAEDRQMLENLLHEEIVFVTRLEVRKAVLAASADCVWRGFVDDVISQFGEKPQKTSFSPFGRYYLGGIDGEIELPEVPTSNDGCLWIVVRPVDGLDSWRVHPVPEYARISFDEAASELKRMENPAPALPKRIAYSIRNILPGRYYVNVIWRKQVKAPVPLWPGAFTSGDIEEQLPGEVVVFSRIVSEVEPLVLKEP